MIQKSAEIITRLQELGDKDTAIQSRRFFKTAKGEYGEGDVFLGIRVPVIRECVKEFMDISLPETIKVLESPFHEARIFALLMLVGKFKRNDFDRKKIFDAYLDHTGFINNWDLVDCSAEHIIGAFLFAENRRPLYRLAKSENLWERRMAIIATFHFIRKNDFSDTLAIAEQLLDDREDLIHKAVGWMLREIGNRDLLTEKKFLKKHYQNMPRTMLRYAIEKFAEPERLAYLKGTK